MIVTDSTNFSLDRLAVFVDSSSESQEPSAGRVARMKVEDSRVTFQSTKEIILTDINIIIYL